ncbi:MAG: S46 family peptidase, partial [Planctomycetota bacterium]
KKAAEDALRAAVNADPAMKAKWGTAWDDVAAAKKIDIATSERRALLGRATGGSILMGKASTIVRLVAELPKPSSERLREFGDAQLDSLYLNLYSAEPIYDSLEIYGLSQALARAAERLGADDPAVVTLLAGKSPAARAAELVKAGTLRDPAARKALVAGGAKAVAESKDPMVRLAIALDPESRELRKKFEDAVESPLREAYSKIGAAKFAIQGDSVYPDATFTLRLSFGPIKGFVDAGEKVPAFTTFAGLYERGAQRKGQEGFEIPQKWLDAKGKLDLKTPFNFVCTADIIGGNSGSPIVNARGEVVGLVFDGNIHSLVGNYVYNQESGRAVGVDSRGLIEAIRTVYGADALVRELTGK